MSKGSHRRPENTASFGDSYDAIFGKSRPNRGSYVYDDSIGRVVPKHEFVRTKGEVNAPMVMNDIAGYKSMQTGEWISSRSQHRAHLKQHRLIEIGNEKIPEPKVPQYDSAAVKRELARHFYN